MRTACVNRTSSSQRSGAVFLTRLSYSGTDGRNRTPASRHVHRISLAGSQQLLCHSQYAPVSSAKNLLPARQFCDHNRGSRWGRQSHFYSRKLGTPSCCDLALLSLLLPFGRSPPVLNRKCLASAVEIVSRPPGSSVSLPSRRPFSSTTVSAPIVLAKLPWTRHTCDTTIYRTSIRSLLLAHSYSISQVGAVAVDPSRSRFGWGLLTKWQLCSSPVAPHRGIARSRAACALNERMF